MQEFKSGIKKEITPLKSSNFLFYPFRFIKHEWKYKKSILALKLLGVLLVIFCGLLYLFINKYNDIRFTETKPFIWMLNIDQHIPFSKYFVIPYYFYYLYVPGTLLALFFRKDYFLFFRHVFTITLGSIIASLIFILFPTYVPRITLTEKDFLTQMIKYIYSIDPPYNCFPSMHVFYTFVCFWHLSLLKKNSFWFMVFNVLSFLLISISTVFTKQHYTPDIVGGLALGVITCLISTWIYSRYPKA